MNLLQRIFNNNNNKKNTTLAAQPKAKRFLPYAQKSISRTRQDIQSWNRALQQAQAEEPKNFALQLLYNDVLLDAHLSSQIENRKQQVFSAAFSLLNASGNVDDAQTAALKMLPAYRQLTNLVLDSIYFGYSIAELELTKGENAYAVNVLSIPRTNIVPQLGRFYKDYSEDKYIQYRDMKEYGTWILEFDSQNLGLLNKTISHVLFKRFAQSCWSELCEIYGIPPRVMKTNTQDTVMLNRAEQMMKDMGAAAWFVIDELESFEWAQGVSTNGDVYANLIRQCSNEISLLISGAVLGQDTKNGNESKEAVSQDMLWNLVQSDMAMVETAWNNTILPALAKLGILNAGITFKFEPAEDSAQLWQRTREAFPYFTVDPDWVKEKFGIEITGERQAAPPQGSNLAFREDFFI